MLESQLPSDKKHKTTFKTAYNLCEKDSQVK